MVASNDYSFRKYLFCWYEVLTHLPDLYPSAQGHTPPPRRGGCSAGVGSAPAGGRGAAGDRPLAGPAGGFAQQAGQ
jgi:hypothetical protein